MRLIDEDLLHFTHPFGIFAGRTNRNPLARAEAIWRASAYPGSGQTLADQSIKGHDMQLGSAAGSDTNDPLFLPFTGTQYLYLPGIANNAAIAPDADVLDFSGDFDIRVVCALDDWTPAAQQALVAKYETVSNQRSFQLRVEVDGKIALVASTTGVNTPTMTSTVAPTVTDGAILAIRCVYDSDNGAAGRDVLFYTKATSEATAYADALSDSGWTQLGATQTVATAAAVFASTATLTVGATGTTGGGVNAAGKFYAAIIKDGIAGTTAFACDFRAPTAPFATFSESSTNAATVTINRSTSGRKAAIVDRPLFLFGTDDYTIAPASSGFDIGAGGSLTIMVICRVYGAPSGALISHKSASAASAPGWRLVWSGTRTCALEIADGTNGISDTSGTVAAGVVGTYVGVRYGSRAKLAAFANNATDGTPETTDTTGDISNAGVTVDLSHSPPAGGNLTDYEFIAAAFWREALSYADINAAARVLAGA